MFDVLLSLCLAGVPSVCHVERHPGGATYADCTATAESLREASAEVAQEWPCVPAGTDPAFHVTEIAPGVFVHKGRQEEAGPGNHGDIANLGFVIGERAVAVIDTGGSAEVGRALLAAIRARTDLPVEWAILTHVHPAHSLGASVFADAGAKVVGHRHLARALAARVGIYLEASARLIGPAFAGTEAPRHVAEAPAEIDLGGQVLRLTEQPTGHTDNDLTVLDLTTGTWFLGDLLFVDRVPALDGSLTGWIDLLPALEAQPAALAVPGHGPVAVSWPGAAAPMESYLEGLADEARAAIEAGTPMLATVEAASADDPTAWLLFPRFHQRNVSAAYQELESE